MRWTPAWLALLCLSCSGIEPSASESSGPADTTGGDGDGDGDGAPELDANYVFDQAALRTYALEIAADDWAQLNADLTAELYVPAQLHFEGQTWGPIGVRYKGGYGSLFWCVDDQGQQICPKLSMKLKFSEYDPDLRFYGLKRLNLHAMAGIALPGQPSGDPSKLHDRLGYNLFRDFGVVAPRAVHARVTINGELVGLFVVVEEVDGRFTDDRFGYDSGGDGNLYKEVWPVHFNEGPYLEALETNVDQNPSAAKMLAFATALANAGDPGFSPVIEQWMDADVLMRYIAVDRAIENWDGIVGIYDLPAGNHNYFWYEEQLRDRMWLIPWDLDHTFDHPNFLIETYGAPAWNEVPQNCDEVPTFFGIGRHPAMCDDFIRRIVTQRDAEWRAAAQLLLDTLYTPEELDARVDFYADQIDAAVLEDPDLDYAEWQAAVDELRADLLGLRDQLQAQVDG